VEDVQELVAKSGKVKVIGTRHSFNDLADSSGCLISLGKLNRVISLDRARRQVTAEAGIRYGELCETLHREGYALHNLASLPHISVAGACATATHGSGDRNRNLAASVCALEIVKADGEIVKLSRDQADGDFNGAVVGLGGLGVVTRITLDVIPAFRMSQYVYDDLPLMQLEEHFDAIFSSAYSVSLFTDWKRPVFNQVWRKQVLTDGKPASADPEFYGAVSADGPRHPVAGMPTENCSEQLGVPGPWHERLPHFRMAFTPSAGDELQSEYFVPRERAFDALCAIDGMRERIAPLLHTSEIRTIAADDLWMSPCFRQDSVGIHFTWKADWPAVRQVLPLIEERLAPFRARPHWGKLFAMPPERLQPLYEKLPDFRNLLERFDPEGKFRNAYLNRYIFQ
jgi:xylitol oxidase